MLAQYVFWIPYYYVEYLLVFPILSGRLNARARFRAMADQSMPLNSISLGETVLSEPADRELELVRTWFITKDT